MEETDKPTAPSTYRAFTTDERQQLVAARLNASVKMSYFASALFQVYPICTELVPTMAINAKWQLFINPQFLMENPVNYLAGVLVHEVNHVLRKHSDRFQKLPSTESELAGRKIWNTATDAAINDDLVQTFDFSGGNVKPILPWQFGAKDGGLEENYYEKLIEDKKSSCEPNACIPNQPECGSGAGNPGNEPVIPDAPVVTRAEGELIRRNTAVSIRNASTRGDEVPEGFRIWAEATLESKVDWRRVLRGSIRRARRTVAGGGQTSYRRPDRRADSHSDFIYPGKQRAVADIAIVVDTSGSMDQALLDQALSEVQSVVRAAKGQVTVLSCDSSASIPRVVRSISEIELFGGGGTDMRIGIDAAAELKPKPQIIVVLTDGYTPWPSAAPDGTQLVAVVIDDGDERYFTAELPSGPGISSVRITE